MKTVWWRNVLLSLALVALCTSLFGNNAWADDGSFATGLEEPTAAQLEWMKKNFPTIKKIHLNSLALERINSERESKGLRKFLENEVAIAPLGEEMEFDSSAEGTVTDFDGALPSYVDNSLLPAFPPIRSQGNLPSCVAWATTYYQFTYENNFERGHTASSNDNIFSPKWTYNMINGGSERGTYFADAYSVLFKHGAVSWAEFPYDDDFREWCLYTDAWREAINYRPLNCGGQISNPDTEVVINDLKAELANGHVIVIGTYVHSWVDTTIKNDPGTTEDDAFVGQMISSYMDDSRDGGHGMTLVGYNDNIWCDLNKNNSVDTGEKGAFKIANSWGTSDWNNGYRWVTYDSLRRDSAAPEAGTWPTNDRYSSGIFRGTDMYIMTASESYAPKVVAEFTINHAKRGQLQMFLGIGETSASTPASTWYPAALNYEPLHYTGGNYAFDGTTTACDGTFVLDFTGLVPSTSVEKRWFVGMYDNRSGDTATMKAYRLYEVTPAGDVLVGTSTGMPKTADRSQAYAWIDYTYNSTNPNNPPIANDDLITTAEDTPVTIYVLANDTDVDDDTLTIDFVTQGTNGTVTNDGTDITYDPDPGFNGLDSFSYTVTDGNGGIDTATVTVNVVEVAPYIDQTATGEVSIHGSVSGSLVDTYIDDGVAESITEITTGGRPQNRQSYLEHKWIFNVEAGTTVTLYANVWAPPSSDGDNFIFSYSIDDLNFETLFTVATGSDDGNYQSSGLVLPSGFTGTVYVRVVDTDLTVGHRSKDTLYIDHIFIRINNELPDLPAAPSGLNATVVSGSQIDLNWTDKANNELGFYIERSPNGLNSWEKIGEVGPDVANYSDTGLTPQTTYCYQVQAYNSAGPSDYSNNASATTADGGDSVHIGDLDGSSSPGRKNRWNATVIVTVLDANGDPVSGATVTGVWSDGANGSSSAVTNTTGQCEIMKSNIKTDVNAVKLTITNVQHDSDIYDYGSNYDQDGDSDGTLIIVDQEP